MIARSVSKTYGIRKALPAVITTREQHVVDTRIIGESPTVFQWIERNARGLACFETVLRDHVGNLLWPDKTTPVVRAFW